MCHLVLLLYALCITQWQWTKSWGHCPSVKVRVARDSAGHFWLDTSCATLTGKFPASPVTTEKPTFCLTEYQSIAIATS